LTVPDHWAALGYLSLLAIVPLGLMVGVVAIAAFIRWVVGQ